MKFEGAKPIIKKDDYDFKTGDLVIPNTGLESAFYYKEGYILDNRFLYHKASDAEAHLLFDRIIHGINNFGYNNSEYMFENNIKAYVKNYKDI